LQLRSAQNLPKLHPPWPLPLLQHEQGLAVEVVSGLSREEAVSGVRMAGMPTAPL